MSTDAWIEEHWIGEAVLPRPRRAPKLPALPLPHAPTCSRGNAALAAYAQSRDSARHPGDGLSARQDGRNVVDQQARQLTQPYVVGVPVPSKGEIVAAAVELRAGAAADTASIIAFCRERLASYKVPIQLAFRTAAQLPRTPTGKIHKPTLSRELAAQPNP